MAVNVVTAYVLAEVNLAKAGNVPEDLFVYRPERSRIHHRLVIEADRQQAVQLADEGKDVEVKRGKGILQLDPHPFGDRSDAGADVRGTVYGDQTIGTGAAAAQKSAWAMVFERAAEDSHARRIES